MILPFTKDQIEHLTKSYTTPFYIYDEGSIRNTARAFNDAFNWVPGGFKNYFAVKALPNPYILEILKEEKFGADCSSLPELIIADASGMKGEDIMFTSNNTPLKEFRKAKELEAIINLDDIKHISFLEKHVGIPEVICFRYNPGSLREGNEIIGNPVEAKYGLTKEQIFFAYEIVKNKGIKRFGLHNMIVSNMLDINYLTETANMSFDLVGEISSKTNIRFEFVNLGGGIGIPYKPEDKPINLDELSLRIKKSYEEKIQNKGLGPLQIFMECGRAITGPYGFLISRVRHVTHKYRDFIGLDASMADLMRPGMYSRPGNECYHPIIVLGKENWAKSYIYDVTGSLCENNDKFAIQRALPKIEEDDLVAIGCAGAHSHAMGFQYNGKLRSAEFLRKPNGNFKMIRRAEEPEDYFTTLNFPGSKFSELSK